MAADADLSSRFADAWRGRHQDPRATLEVAEGLRDEATAAGDDLSVGRALTLAGACHVALNDYPAALRALTEARSLLADGPLEDLARAQVEAGHLNVLIGDHPGGTELLLEALTAYEQLDDRPGQAFTLNRIGIAFYDHGELDDAEHAYARALALTSQDDEVVAAGLHNNLAKVQTARGGYDQALTHLRAARTTFTALDEQRGLAMTLHNAGVVYESTGDVARAAELYAESIDRYARAGHEHGACEARTRLARLRMGDGQLVDATRLLTEAYEQAERLGVAREQARAAEVLVELHEQRGDLAEALQWAKRLRTVERRSFDHDSEQRLRSLQVRFQLDQVVRDSITDALTGILNRRGLDRALEDRVAAARETGEPLALILLDLDDFKVINDRHSHSVGDEVLRDVGEALRSRSRPTDVCARYGGEEFVVALPGCDHDDAHAVAATLGEAIRSLQWDHLDPQLQVTASAGIAMLAEGMDAHGLLAAADRALYEAKSRGKDQVQG